MKSKTMTSLRNLAVTGITATVISITAFAPGAMALGDLGGKGLTFAPTESTEAKQICTRGPGESWDCNDVGSCGDLALDHMYTDPDGSQKICV